MTARKGFKRFYKNTIAVAVEGGFTVELDGRRIRTPKAQPFVISSQVLAEAIAAEWQAQGEIVDPQAMPLTGLANAAIDHVSSDPGRFVDQIVSYAANDLLCYRAETPPKLIERQAAAWDPLIAWAGERLGVRLNVVSGVMPREQAPDALQAVRRAVASRDAFALAGLFSAVTLTGSAILGLGLAEGWLSAVEAWHAARVDEIMQAEDWGRDDEAEIRARRMGEELANAERFLRLLKG
jgi:chaperone required for assembly of F1-ATPase